MSYEIAIINPTPAKKKSRRRATPKQLAARRRFVAKFGRSKKARRSVKRRKSPTQGIPVMAKRRRKSRRARNAKGHFVKRSHAVRRRKRNTSARRRRRASGYVAGPRRIRRRKLNPSGHRRRRYNRNPSLMRGLSVNNVVGQLVPAAYGAGGAIALNLGLSYLPLPDVLKSGWPRHITRLVGAMAVGWAGRKFLGARGAAVGAGALTVVMYDILKGLVGSVSPEIGTRLGEFEDVSLNGDDDGIYDPASIVTADGYLDGPDGADGDDMSAYMEGDLDGMAAYMENGEL